MGQTWRNRAVSQSFAQDIWFVLAGGWVVAVSPRTAQIFLCTEFEA